MADVTGLRSTRHDVQKDTSEQTTFVSPTGNEKRIDYILTKRRHLRHNKDAEANDMIHMGSDHRCVMATFTITMPGKHNHYKNTEGKHDMIKHEKRDQTGNNIGARKKIPRDHRKLFFLKPPQKKTQRKQKVKM